MTIGARPTVGKTLEEDRFYLMSRGIPVDEARAMIVNGLSNRSYVYPARIRGGNESINRT